MTRQRPTKVQVLEQREGVVRALSLLRDTLLRTAVQEAALIELETFCAVACRVMAKTNVSKLIDETRTVEIAARMAGRIVFDPGD